jgi:hypothetical protein
LVIVLRPKAELLLRTFLNAPGRLLAPEALIDDPLDCRGEAQPRRGMVRISR